MISIVERAATVGVGLWRTSLKSATGMVEYVGVAISPATTTSSQDVRNARTNPAKTPGKTVKEDPPKRRPWTGTKARGSAFQVSVDSQEAPHGDQGVRQCQHSVRKDVAEQRSVQVTADSEWADRPAQDPHQIHPYADRHARHDQRQETQRKKDGLASDLGLLQAQGETRTKHGGTESGQKTDLDAGHKMRCPRGALEDGRKPLKREAHGRKRHDVLLAHAHGPSRHRLARAARWSPPRRTARRSPWTD